jgi:hypothetical protein
MRDGPVLRRPAATRFTSLWHPEKALEVYQEMDRLHPSRPLREQGSYIIDKAQAFFHLGDLDHGLKLSLQGIKLAQEYRSHTISCAWILPMMESTGVRHSHRETNFHHTLQTIAQRTIIEGIFSYQLALSRPIAYTTS